MHFNTKLRCLSRIPLHKIILIFGGINIFILIWMLYEYNVYNSWREILQNNQNRPDLMQLMSSSSESTGLRVYIVEEHHEVIPYWFSAAKSFGNKKAVLVHIDAHSDMDYPEVVDNFPINRFPCSNEEIETLMQANDEFIQSAIIANLIQSVYIIYPYWTFNTSYAYTSSLGIISINDTQQVCMCLEIDDNNEDDDEQNCKTRRQDNSLTDIFLSIDKCSKTWIYHYAELNSRTASNILRYSKNWSLNKLLNMSDFVSSPNTIPSPHVHRTQQHHHHHHPLILDIDEDFFGVHLVTRSLLKTGLTTNFIYTLNNLISSIFCPLSNINELDIDQIFRWLLEKVYLHSNYYSRSSPIQGYTLNKIVTKTNKNLHINDLFCYNYLLNLQRLNELFINNSITHRQFNAITRVGVCFTNSLLTHQYIPEIHLCIGHNIPNASLVEEFIPTSNDLLQLGVQFTQILLSIPYQPNVISISRSSRDGYTPRWLQYNIETLILNILKRVFNLTDENIIFTKYLAGDKYQGWYRRFSWTNEEE
ncbi:unnamed protein product [Heterobilharzia americana]|nr:unnamed protein product [Heterobilharzia americana]